MSSNSEIVVKSIRISLLLLALELGGIMCVADNSQSNSPRIEKPWYYIRVDVAGSPYDIRVNDCPIISDEEGFGTVVEMPINPWIFNGNNSVSVMLERNRVDKGTAEIRIMVKEEGAGNLNPITIARLETEAPQLMGEVENAKTGDDDESRAIEELHMEKSVRFVVEVPFIIWRWMDVKPLNLTEEDRSAIISKARALREILNRANMDQLVIAMDHKIDETARARYISKEARTSEFVTNYKELFNKTEWKSYEFDSSDLEIVPYGNNRLFLLRDSVTGESPVFFVDKNEETAHYIELFFYKSPKGNWEIIR